ncbi:HET domain containing protein [Tolypocladium paradoxum]|uniref:HET domain containing protein n=1 Tax=Tolypocladium paradoxum TaxID=94208 RepID=A0A2S4KS49_9HYPO|nr:HET domain containing protein [Tolypocladium paradoxum]
MRLLNVYTLRLKTFLGTEEDVPPYAILSHTWDKSEVTFEDMRTEKPNHPPLSSQTTRWKCRFLLLAVELIAPRNVVFFDKKWIEFGTRDEGLFRRICDRTGILPRIFTSRHCMCSTKTFSSLRDGKCEACNAKDNLLDILGSLNASVIMSWAANRSTTRKEDIAYALIGLFNVSMPLLYGEGDKAFMRLQAAILAHSNDHSILLWRAKPDRDEGGLRPGCLARSPKAFESAPPIVPQREYYDFDNEMMPRLAVGLSDNIEPMEVSETLLTVTLWLCPCRVGHPFDDMSDETPRANDWTLGILNGSAASDYFVRPAILLSHMGADLYRRIACDAIFLVNPRRRLYTPVTTTLSVYHRYPNTPDPHSNWTVIEQVSLEKGLRKEIKLLVRPSGPSLLRSARRTYDRISSSSDAVCCVVNQPQRCCHSITTRIVGGYPTVYSQDSCPPMVPMLRGLVKYDCSRGLGLIGGIHLFEAGVLTMSLRVGIYVIWGLHHDHAMLHDGIQQEPAGKPWCRIFNSMSFTRDSGIRCREQEEDDLRYQKQLYTWLVKNSRDPNWQVTDERGVRKKVLPDLAHAKGAAADRMLDLFPGSKMRMGLSARMNIVQGFGITSNDVELTFLTPECSGWHSDSFDGSQKDQELE